MNHDDNPKPCPGEPAPPKPKIVAAGDRPAPNPAPRPTGPTVPKATHQPDPPDVPTKPRPSTQPGGGNPKPADPLTDGDRPKVLQAA